MRSWESLEDHWYEGTQPAPPDDDVYLPRSGSAAGQVVPCGGAAAMWSESRHSGCAYSWKTTPKWEVI